MSGGASPAVTPTLSDFRSQLYANTWYSKLLILWYLLSIAIAADLLYNIPLINGASDLANSPSAQGLLLSYFIWILLDVAILWISTLVFFDEHLQNKWNSLEVGRNLGSDKLSRACVWAFVITVLLMVSISWDVINDMVGFGI
jgi:hypothetical protein